MPPREPPEMLMAALPPVDGAVAVEVAGQVLVPSRLPSYLVRWTPLKPRSSDQQQVVHRGLPYHVAGVRM